MATTERRRPAASTAGRRQPGRPSPGRATAIGPRDERIAAAGAAPAPGLTEAEAAIRRARGEGNDAAPPTGRSYRQILRANVLTPMHAILLGLAALLIAFGRTTDAVLTGGIVLVNAALNVAQEVRAKRLLDRIALLARPTVTIVREGRHRVVDPAVIVRGDTILAGRGDQIVVDGRVAWGQLEVDESLLTGESEPVIKGPGDALLSGSACVAGAAGYEAEQVGAASFANRLTARARAFRAARTPLQREVDVLVRVMTAAAAALALIFALAAALRDWPTVEAVRTGAVLASLVPNGLLFTITLAYAAGAVRLAGSGILIQRANAVESLSHVDVLCLDKTGTLTTGRLAVDAAHALAAPPEEFDRLLGDYAASATARNATLEALGAARRGSARPVRAEVPFDSARKWSALALDDGTYALGAPEVLLPEATWRDTPLPGWIAAGLRVLLLARVPDNAALRDPDGRPRLPGGLEPLGLVAVRDELRPEAAATVRHFAAAGVAIKVISGDHPGTVAALARRVGLGGGRVLTGADLDALDDAGFARAAEEGTIFARATPAQKERLVAALRAGGRHVAMIGDGVNDVPALKRADLAIAPGGGSGAARAVADLVLLDGSFAALPRALGEGQRIVNGLRDSLALYLVRFGGTVLTILAVGLAAGEFPFIPANNALVAFLTLGTPTLALVAWARPGAPPRRGLIRSLAPFAAPAAVLLAGLALGVFAAAFAGFPRVADGAALATARGALTTALVLGGLVVLASLRAHGGAGDAPGASRRLALLAGGLLALYGLALAAPPTRRFFELTPLGAAGYAAIVAAVAVWALLLQLTWRARLFERLLGFGRARLGAAPAADGDQPPGAVGPAEAPARGPRVARPVPPPARGVGVGLAAGPPLGR